MITKEQIIVVYNDLGKKLWETTISQKVSEKLSGIDLDTIPEVETQKQIVSAASIAAACAYRLGFQSGVAVGYKTKELESKIIIPGVN